MRFWIVGFSLLFPAISLAAESYVETRLIASPHAVQAAAADEKFVYAVASKVVAKIDRDSGKELAVSQGDASHLNSALILDGKVFCAHSNYPKQPEESDIRVLDPETMRLTLFHRFENPPGSLTWVLKRDGSWWCHFAHYLLANEKSILVRFDKNWNETGRWNYPSELVKDWGKMSLSGAIFEHDFLLATGHDKKRIYRLKIPQQGKVVEWIDTMDAPFPGQGIAADLKTGGLVGIDRKKKSVVFAELEKSGDAGE